MQPPVPDLTGLVRMRTPILPSYRAAVPPTGRARIGKCSVERVEEFL